MRGRRRSLTRIVRFPDTDKTTMNLQRLHCVAKARTASLRAGQSVTGTSDHHGSFSVVGIRSHGELDLHERLRSARLPDCFAAEGRHRLTMGGLSGGSFRDRKPNQSLETPMRVVKRVVKFPSGFQVFPFRKRGSRGAQRSGAESRAGALAAPSGPISPAPVGAWVTPFLKSVFSFFLLFLVLLSAP